MPDPIEAGGRSDPALDMALDRTDHGPVDGTSLRDLLQVAGLGLELVAGDQARLDLPVRWTHTTELLYPAPYLRGGELVCTVGALLVDERSCRTFVSAASAARAVGLCFGLGDVHEVIPPALVEACHSAHLPLLQAPLGMPFLAIAEYLAERRTLAAGRDNLRIESLLTELLDGLRSQASVASMMAMAVRTLEGCLSLVVDGRPIAVDAPERAVDGVLVTAALGPGTVFTWSGAGAPPGLRVLARLGRVIELASHGRNVEDSLKRERTGQLLLLVGDRLANPVALRPMLEELGIGDGPLVISAWPAGSAPLLAVHMAGGLISEAPGIALAVTRTAEEVAAASGVLLLPCGFSRSVALVDAAGAIAESIAALQLSRRRGVIVGPASLTSLEGLLEQQPIGRLDPFVDQLLTPLISADELQGTRALETLRSFLRNEGSLQRTAEDQYVHVNTVRHRLMRIHRITGHDPLVFADRIALAIALWAFDRRQNSRR